MGTLRKRSVGKFLNNFINPATLQAFIFVNGHMQKASCFQKKILKPRFAGRLIKSG